MGGSEGSLSKPLIADLEKLTSRLLFYSLGQVNPRAVKRLDCMRQCRSIFLTKNICADFYLKVGSYAYKKPVKGRMMEGA